MCLTPFTVRNKLTNESIPVPCGRCPSCLARRVSGWSFRLMQEDKISTSAVFLTLTFDTANVPLSNNGFMTLEKKPFQLFMKRLRKAHGKDHPPLRYYACGEYGGVTQRPHYHAILFNANVELIAGAWAIDGKPIGNIHYGSVTGASVGYTLKYMNKPKRKPQHQRDDRLPEFALMSKDWVRPTSILPPKNGIMTTFINECISLLRTVKK